MEYFINRSGLQLAYRFSIKYPDSSNIYILCPMWPPQLFLLSDFIFERLDANMFKFDFTGNGNSQGEHTYAGFLRDADDIDDAVKFVTGRGYTVKGIIGHLKFGTCAIIYSAVYGEVKTIISIYPRYNMNILLPFIRDNYELIKQNNEVPCTAFGKEWKWTWDMIEENMNLDMKYYCENVKSDIFIIYGDTGDFCSSSDLIDLERELKEKCKGRFVLQCDEYFIGVFDEVLDIIEKIIADS